MFSNEWSLDRDNVGVTDIVLFKTLLIVWQDIIVQGLSVVVVYRINKE